jgi:hypothetical protein
MTSEKMAFEQSLGKGTAIAGHPLTGSKLLFVVDH